MRAGISSLSSWSTVTLDFLNWKLASMLAKVTTGSRVVHKDKPDVKGRPIQVNISFAFFKIWMQHVSEDTQRWQEDAPIDLGLDMSGR
jgi:hypothetical protein